MTRHISNYYVYVSRGVTAIGLTDVHGEQTRFELPTEDAREFFKRGELATREPATIGGWLWRKMRLKHATKG